MEEAGTKEEGEAEGGEEEKAEEKFTPHRQKKRKKKKKKKKKKEKKMREIPDDKGKEEVRCSETCSDELRKRVLGLRVDEASVTTSRYERQNKTEFASPL